MDGARKDVSSREYALLLDAQDPLFRIREQFLIPSKTQLKAESLQVGKIALLSPLLAKAEKFHSVS
jgi:hypothetical protein